MLHGRPDYNRIQDPDGIIATDEPVFLLRAQDAHAPDTVEHWAIKALLHGADLQTVDGALKQAQRMRVWQMAHLAKTPDAPSVA